MTDQPLYANVSIESTALEVVMYDHNKLDQMIRRYKPRYIATITVEFDDWIPASISEILRTGVLK